VLIRVRFNIIATSSHCTSVTERKRLPYPSKIAGKLTHIFFKSQLRHEEIDRRVILISRCQVVRGHAVLSSGGHMQCLWEHIKQSLDQLLLGFAARMVPTVFLPYKEASEQCNHFDQQGQASLGTRRSAFPSFCLHHAWPRT